MTAARQAIAVLTVLCGLPGIAMSEEAAAEDDDLEDMSLEELLGVEVTTASNMRESLSRAPGVVIRLSREDLEARGYHELLDLFDDLPGMDVIRPSGDNYLKVYWRGYRTDVTHPFLVMIDGMVVNSLWSTDASVASAFPISEVDHIEIVYGPVSAVYGANAFMGVVNVFTVAGVEGAPQARLRLTGGSYDPSRVDRRTIDGVVTHKTDELEVVIGGRLSLGNTDLDAAERFEYSRAQYANDPALWGGYLEFDNLADGTRSPIEQYGIDARVRFGGLEVGAMSLQLLTGYGVVYATDLVQPNAGWVQYERSAHLAYTAELDEGVTSRSMVRVRDSGIDNRSYFLSGFNDAAMNRVLELSYWQARNQSLMASQSVEAEIGEAVTVVAGGDLERRNLHGAYDVVAGPHLAPEDVGQDVELPSPPPDDPRDVERPRMDAVGAYAQVRYRREKVLSSCDAHALHAGLRYDHNSVFGRAHSPTLRLGYVGEADTTTGLWVGKLLYGEGFHEPNPRQLYGGWLGSGSDPTLEPEASRTFEVNVSHTTDRYSNLLSAYYVNNYDTIVQFAGGAANKGRRSVFGVDWHGRALFRAPHVDRISLWAFYSYIWSEELTFDAAGASIEAPIGDLAAHKAWLGGTVERGRYRATLRARAIADRETVATNPVREIGGHVIVDTTLGADEIAGTPLAVRLRVDNLVGTGYSHPGIRTADSGEVPGRFVGGQWVGAAGYYNSRLPQPGRSVWLTLGLDL